MGFEQEFAELLDSRVKVGRKSFGRADTSTSYATETMTVVATGVPMSIDRVGSDLIQRSYGKDVEGRHEGFTGPDRDVAPGDVVQVTSGPKAGEYFVVGPGWKPQSEHREFPLALSEKEKQWAADNPW